MCGFGPVLKLLGPARFQHEDQQGVALVLRPSYRLVFKGVSAFFDSVFPFSGECLVIIAPFVGCGAPYLSRPARCTDRLFGNSGNDTLNGGAGADRMAGGAGNDRYFVNRIGDSVVEGLGQGIDKVFSTISHSLADNVEALVLTGTAFKGVGNSLNNLIRGNAGDNKLLGARGNDTLKGGDGNDLLFGGIGNDTLDGGSGGDRLFGQGGNDRLIGRGGNDRMGGGPGNDRLFGNSGNDKLGGGAGNDIITGGAGNDLFIFKNGDGNDRITDFTAGAGSDDALDVRSFGFGSAAAAIAAATQVGANTVIALDGDDSVTLLGVNLGDLTADDFLI